MRKAFCLFIIILGFCFTAMAGDYPAEWSRYTFGGYVYDIQSDHNDSNIPETEFKNRLLDIARSNLAKQIQIRVQDVATLNKSSVNGQAAIIYSAHSEFSTDLNMKLVTTRSHYDQNTGMGSAIAFIDKEAALRYYSNELMFVYSKTDNAVTMAEDYISAGFNAKAKTSLQSALAQLGAKDEPLFWMNIFGIPQEELTDWQTKLNTEEQKIRKMLAELEHGTVIYLSCKADMFGKAYTALQNELKGILSADGCSFTDRPADADWVINITCTSRRHTNATIAGMNTFIAYVDTRITIDKVKTSQRIYEDGQSVKGAHTLNYDEAARAAYKNAKQQIGTIITKNINQ